jgi:hypothetical protein
LGYKQGKGLYEAICRNIAEIQRERCSFPVRKQIARIFESNRGELRVKSPNIYSISPKKL